MTLVTRDTQDEVSARAQATRYTQSVTVDKQSQQAKTHLV